MGLWKHQQEAVDAINSAWKSGVRAVLDQLCTGGGKSRIIRTIVDQQAKNKKVIYIIAHRKTLVNQLSEELKEAGLLHGVIKSGCPYIRYRVQVCSMQTLVRRLDKLPEPELIIVDECHHLKSGSYLKILDHWKDAKLLGMTATPQRSDGKSLDMFQTLILGPSMRSLIENKSLSDYDYFAPEEIDMSDVKVQAGEYNIKQSLEKVDKACITGNAIEHYKKYADHKPTICCCISISHSEHVAKEFVDAGYKALAVNSKMKPFEIDNAINGLKNGTLEILTQCDMLGEGVDIKGAECLIMLRPTHSLVIFLQQAGRVLRSAPGKEKAIILDHVGNYKRFGLPDDDREWSLKGKPKKADKGISTKKHCPECLMVVSKSENTCPYCGFQWTETIKKGKREIEEKEGKLIAIKQAGKPDILKLQSKLAYAHNLKEAIKFAKELGFDHRAAWEIWTKVFKNKESDIIYF